MLINQDFLLQFDLAPLKQLDQFALLACQDYNYGNTTDWFGDFRGGLHALYARVYAVRKHYYEVHAWIPARRLLADAEYHLASIFFNMDSAIECFTFAINALGNCIAPAQFKNVTDPKALKAISPINILGDPVRNPPVRPLPGYMTYFPTLQTLWDSRRDLIERVVAQHDVSKHRKTIFHGGQLRLDPPPGFHKALGIADETVGSVVYHPMAEIILDPDPKSPLQGRMPIPVQHQIQLEPLAERFASFISESA
jgi:hypothetical protein